MVDLTSEMAGLWAALGPAPSHRGRVIQVVAANSGEGASTVAREYARRLVNLRRELAGQICLVMRVYCEKPRTTVGWTGFINDPRLDGSEDVPAGLRQARGLLLEINDLGLLG